MHYAVVGGGFSGLLAAYLLEKKGKKVTLYEKEEILGGHCRTIVNKDIYGEIGTVFSFSDHIKELLIELDVDYRERYTYRNFLDDHFSKSQHISFEALQTVIKDLSRLQKLIQGQYPATENMNYGYIPKDLLQPLDQFLMINNLHSIHSLISPMLSSFGFGCISDIPAYYALNIFTVDTILSFIKGEKLLFVNKGMSEIVHRFSQNISDIRYSVAVEEIETKDHKVLIKTPYGQEVYDQVLITAKLSDPILRDDFYRQAMEEITTNPYFTCAYEIENQKIVTTYYKPHLGKTEKIQFFHIFKQNNKCILVAYAYGLLNPHLVKRITGDIEKSGVKIKRLITTKQWEIFPHVPGEVLRENFYSDLLAHQRKHRIKFIGSLISKPSISNLCASVKGEVNELCAVDEV